jgi:hypothetical protein
MGVAGLGVGSIFAVMPGLIVGSVPSSETGSATSFNQVIRYIGFATGSALSAMALQARTAPGHLLPAGSGYTLGGLISCGVWAVAAVASLVLPRLRVRVSVPATRKEAEVLKIESPDSVLPHSDGDHTPDARINT